MTAILEHYALGQTARYERFMAEMIYLIAAGLRIDPDKATGFGTQVDKVYNNPFEKVPVRYQPQTAAEIKDYIVKRLLEGTDGSAEFGRED